MSSTGDPPRMVEPDSPASSRLRELLAESRADIGTDREVQKLEALLAPLLGPPVAVPGAAKAAAGKGAAALGAKVAVGALLISGGVWLAASQANRVSPRVPHEATVTTATAPLAAIEVSPPVPVPVPIGSAVAGEEADEPLPSNGSANARVNRTARSSLSEADLLGQAQTALPRDPAHALTLTEQHRREFPHGVLVQEREVIAIEALARLGRNREASARGERFLRAFPASAHESKIESIVGAK